MTAESWGTLAYRGETREVAEEPFWDEGDLVFRLVGGGRVRVRGAHVASLSFRGLDVVEDCEVIVGNNRTWSAPAAEGQTPPDVEVTIEKVLDGYPLVYLLAAR
jgi:hypothetical protein